jgi:hypothetical protein
MPETPYGILLTTFFHGRTGMRLQALGNPGKDALLLGAFLTANDWANMIGLYELSLGKIARHLPILKSRSVLRAFAVLDQERFAHYDEPTEVVWVREMARIRLNLVSGRVISNPKMLTGAQNCYQRVPINPFLAPFYDRYHVELALKHRRGDPPQADRQSIADPSPMSSPISETPVVRTQVLQRSSDQVPVHQASVQAVRSNNDQLDQGSSINEEQPAPLRRRPSLEPASFQTLCAIATEVLEQHGEDLDDLSDLTARVKDLCVARQRDYGANLDRLRGAIDGAVKAYQKRRQAFVFRADAPVATETAEERPDPTLRIGRLPMAPSGPDELIPVDGTSAPRGGSTAIGDLASSLRSGNVEDFNERITKLAGGRRG